MPGTRYLQRRTPQRDEKFLATLRGGGSNARAAKVAGYALRTLYTWRDRDPVFAAAWNEAAQDGLDTRVTPPAAPPWEPEPGPQKTAFESAADIVLYGGAAGGGKTDLLLGLALTQHRRSVIFRRHFVDLRAMEDRLIEIIGSREGYVGSDMVLRRDDRVIEFGALEKPGAEFSWQGRPHDFIGFDEGAQLTESKVRFVMGWLRTTDAQQRCRVVIASNPPIGGEGEWLLDWFAPWLDPAFPHPAAPGELRFGCIKRDGTVAWVDGPGTHMIDGDALTALSRTFVPARLDDNPYLRDTDYRSRLMLQPEPLRSKLLNGDFLAGAQDAERQVIPSAWIKAAQERWASRRRDPALRMTTIGVDVAQGGAAETVLAPLYGNRFEDLVKRKGVDTTNGPAVAALVVEHMRDHCQVNIDLSGGWGGSARDHLEAQGINVVGVVFGAGSDQRTRDQGLGFVNLRSQLWWRFREALDPVSGDEVELPPDRRLAAQLAAPTWKPRGAAILIESKDDIRARIGSSTDDADAVILAWHRRDDAMARRRPRNVEVAPAYVGPDSWMA